MNFLEWIFLWTMVATIVLGLISIIHIGFFKMNLLMKIKSRFREIRGNRRKSSKLLFMHIFLIIFRTLKRHMDSSKLFFKSEWKRKGAHGESFGESQDCKCFQGAELR